jgi:hypothetical protein
VEGAVDFGSRRGATPDERFVREEANFKRIEDKLLNKRFANERKKLADKTEIVNKLNEQLSNL